MTDNVSVCMYCDRTRQPGMQWSFVPRARRSRRGGVPRVSRGGAHLLGDSVSEWSGRAGSEGSSADAGSTSTAGCRLTVSRHKLLVVTSAQDPISVSSFEPIRPLCVSHSQIQIFVK